jgi:hypothetical protein
VHIMTTGSQPFFVKKKKDISDGLRQRHVRCRSALHARPPSPKLPGGLSYAVPCLPAYIDRTPMVGGDPQLVRMHAERWAPPGEGPGGQSRVRGDEIVAWVFQPVPLKFMRYQNVLASKNPGHVNNPAYPIACSLDLKSRPRRLEYGVQWHELVCYIRVALGVPRAVQFARGVPWETL